MRPTTIAIIAGLLGLGSSLPLSSTNPTNSTISCVNVTQSNATSAGLTLPLDISSDISNDPLFAFLPSLESYEAIVRAYNKTGLVRRGAPVLPPRGRKLGPKLQDGLPKCWQACFKNVENKTGGLNILEL
ncbi:hypothetical protein VSDG_07515 [Cytospora chrysosperma]|uniref:Uncharacterized protein n=1 Tax=Cytospora chrysosperma TaxID=252740 RepID=A0A423VME7_CYTCH|nr:hypothetical protein VSDG_07515 [Valsa sordida]